MIKFINKFYVFIKQLSIYKIILYSYFIEASDQKEKSINKKEE